MYGRQLFSILVVGNYFFVSTFANPMDIPTPVTPPKSKVDLFQNQSRPACLTEKDDFKANNSLTDRSRLWKNFYAQPDPAYTSTERTAINDAMYDLSQVLPCVNFGIYASNATPSGDYIYIIKGTENGCSSSVGRIGGKQSMNLQSPGCMSKPTIIHEMIHALGFHHEHCRTDRDEYVIVYYENIELGREYNFEKRSGRSYSSFGIAYNPRSIMHYNTYDFSKNGQPTITTKSGGRVGTNEIFQNTDKQKLKNLYRC